MRDASDRGVVDEVWRARTGLERAEVALSARRQVRREERIHAVRLRVADVVPILVVFVTTIGDRPLAQAADVARRRIPDEDAETLLLVEEADVELVVEGVEKPFAAGADAGAARGEIRVRLDERARRALGIVRPGRRRVVR